jgi:cbb3-type cytochrome c oxidase subunit III
MKLRYKKGKEGHSIFLFSVLILTAGCATQKTGTGQQSNQPAIKNIQGEYIYERNCLPCHGSDGTGTFPGSPDLTQDEGFRLGVNPDAALFEHVKHVKQGIKFLSYSLLSHPKGAIRI